MKVIFFTLVISLGVLASAQPMDPEAKVVLDAMSKKYKAMPAFSTQFTQRLTNESAKIDETISGKIAVKGNKYKLDFAGQQIFNDGKDVWTYNPSAKEVTVNSYEADEQEISLSNIWDLYKEGFKYILIADNDNGNYVIDLTPIQRTKKSYFKIRMIISKSHDLVSFTVFENGGNLFFYSVKEFKVENNLADAFFTFNPAKYPGVEVIDFR